MTGPLILLAMQAAPVAAPLPSATPAPKICRSEVATGSIMAKKICHTSAEWQALSEANAREVQRMRGPSSGRGGPSGLGIGGSSGPGSGG